MNNRVWCTECGKSCSNEMPIDIIVRAWIVCPECLEKFDKDTFNKLLEKKREKSS